MKKIVTTGMAPSLILVKLRTLTAPVDRAIGVDTQFVINVADIRKGRSRRRCKLPLIDRPIENRSEVAAGSRRRAPDYSLKPAP